MLGFFRAIYPAVTSDWIVKCSESALGNLNPLHWLETIFLKHFFFLIWNAIFVSSLLRGHSNLLCIVPILEYMCYQSEHWLETCIVTQHRFWLIDQPFQVHPKRTYVLTRWTDGLRRSWGWGGILGFYSLPGFSTSCSVDHLEGCGHHWGWTCVLQFSPCAFWSVGCNVIVLSSRGSNVPSVIVGHISDPFSAPCLEAYLSVPMGCHFSLLSIPFQSLCLFIPSTSLTGIIQLGLLFQIHSDSLCF